MTSSLFLELQNGGAMTPEVLWLILLGWYLVRESKRRGLRALDWFHLPPSMGLMLAFFVSDLGVCAKASTVWIWRRFYGAGDITGWMAAGLVAGSLLIVIGALCKIRAVTEPDHGTLPWIVAATSTVVVMLGLYALRQA